MIERFILRTRKRLPSRRGWRYCLLAVVCATCYPYSVGAIRGAELPPVEGRAEFQLFRNAMQEIATHCIYHLTERQVLAGALKALQGEVGPTLGAAIPSGVDGRTDEELWLIYQESLRKLAHSAENKQSLKSLVELSLRAYCRTLDRYSDYDDYETWQKSLEFAQSDYLGVGITLLAGRADDIVCVPISSGPADHAGIDAGDRLLAVDDHAIRGASLLQINTWIAETQTRSVKLRIRRSDGVVDTIQVPKEPIKFSPVSVEQIGDAWRITLHDISARCVADLREELRSIGPAKTITLDLRGCPGGPVRFAVAIASMFLPADTVIGKLEKLTDTETLHSTNAAPYKPARLTIFQDRFTASGAELIIAALLNYKPLKAESEGEKTYGKGVTILEIPVSGKNKQGEVIVQPGLLTITGSRIYGPSGETWDEKGLPPSSGSETTP